MEYIHQSERLIDEMAKILFFSLKTLLVICSTWMVAPIAEMADQINASHPPIFMFYIFNTLLLSHETIIAISPALRKKFFSAFENDSGKLDWKQFISSWFSLCCIRLFVYGKLLEVHFPDSGGFDDKTYYYLIVIIFILVGGIVLERGLSTVLKKFTLKN